MTQKTPFREEILPLYWEEVEGFWRIELKDFAVEWLDGEVFFPPDSMNRIENAVENAYPGWYHRMTDGKCEKNCKACKEKSLRVNLKYRSSI